MSTNNIKKKWIPLVRQCLVQFQKFPLFPVAPAASFASYLISAAHLTSTGIVRTHIHGVVGIWGKKNVAVCSSLKSYQKNRCMGAIARIIW